MRMRTRTHTHTQQVSNVVVFNYSHSVISILHRWCMSVSVCENLIPLYLYAFTIPRGGPRYTILPVNLNH